MGRQWQPRQGTCLVACILPLLIGAVGGCEAPGPRPGGTVVVMSTAGLDAFNPLVTGSAYTQEANRHLLFVPLLRYDEALRLVPGLAESWALEGDTAAVFHLRNDVTWQDGARTTAYDAAFTYTRALDPRASRGTKKP